MVDQRSHAPASKWSHPVEPGMVQATAQERGPQVPSRIHDASGDRSPHQDIQRHGQTDEQTAEFRSSAIDGCSEDDKDQEKGQDNLRNQSSR